MFAPLLRTVLALATIAVLAQTETCGYEPPDRKGPGEPCTRSDECAIDLTCRGGVCMRSIDASMRDDAGRSDASAQDAGDGAVEADSGRD